MENQHQKIKGYRELTQVEIDLMNRVKEFGPQLKLLIDDIRTHVSQQLTNATVNTTDVTRSEEYERIQTAEPYRWVAIGATDLQTGLMALTRAIAQPSFF